MGCAKNQRVPKVNQKLLHVGTFPKEFPIPGHGAYALMSALKNAFPDRPKKATTAIVFWCLELDYQNEALLFLLV